MGTLTAPSLSPSWHTTQTPRRSRLAEVASGQLTDPAKAAAQKAAAAGGLEDHGLPPLPQGMPPLGMPVPPPPMMGGVGDKKGDHGHDKGGHPPMDFMPMPPPLGMDMPLPPMGLGMPGGKDVGQG